MFKKLLKSKIHRATVTDSNLDYEGSVTLDGALMEEAGIDEFEHVHIWDVTNGARVETYAIRGMPGSGTVCVNGAAAHHIKKGDIVILSAYGWYAPGEAKTHAPRIILVDDKNKVRRC